MTITESAQDYLAELLQAQEDDVLGIRMFVNAPGTPKAETHALPIVGEADIDQEDILVDYEKFTACFESNSIPFLEDAFVDYAKDRMGGQLTIKALLPKCQLPQVNANSPIEDRINYVLFNEVNPSLAAHGGEVSLLEVTDENIAILQFGGGCQGCGMVESTLKDGVEKSLLEQVPELNAVMDMTGFIPIVPTLISNNWASLHIPELIVLTDF